MKDTTNKKFWDRMAFLYAPFQERGNRALYQNLCKRIADGLPAQSDVLELACGSGQLSLPLCQQFRKWEATDYSANMVAQAKRRARGLPVTFAVQDATALTYSDASWDAVVAANMLHIMPDPAAALAEIRRVLKPGGTLVAATFVYDEHFDPKKMAPLERLGFKTYYKWTASEFAQYVHAHGFEIRVNDLLPGNGLSECLFFCEVSA